MKIRFLLMLLAALMLSACSSTFVAYKDGHGYYLGSGSKDAYRMFCESGDLKKILADTASLDRNAKEELYQADCGAERSHEKVRHMYQTMTPEQRKDLRLAFKHNGYDINYLHC